jgi:hypothetical protein
MVGVSVVLATILLFIGDASAGASSGVVVREPQYGFSFTLPSDWKQVPLDGSDVTALLNAATHGDPALKNALTSQIATATSTGMKVIAIGPDQGSSVPSVNVIVTNAASGLPTGRAFASAVIAEAKIQLTEADASHLKTSIVNDRLGTAAQDSYELNSKSLGVVFGTQLTVRHGSKIEIVTVSTSDPTSSRSDARLIADSWRWKPRN